MPQVASDPRIHASSQHMPRVARPAQSDRAPSPFESLLEDTSQPPEPAPPRPESKASASESTQAPAKSKDKSTEPTDNTKPENADSVSAAEDMADDTPVDGNAAAEGHDRKTAMAATPAGVGDSIQPETGTDHEQAPEQTGDDAAAALPAESVLTASTADAVTIVAAPSQIPVEAPKDGEQIEQPAQQLALTADPTPQTKLFGLDVPKPAAEKKADSEAQTDTGDIDNGQPTDQPAGQTADTSMILTKDAKPPHPDNKSQAGSEESDKPHVPQGRSDAAANTNQPDSGGATPPGADISATARALNDARPLSPAPGSTAPHASENAATPAVLVSQPGPQAAAIPLAGVAIEIAGKALAGKNRFEIRLDPPELGRIDVRLDVDRDGNVTSRLTVDRPETLDLLRRDATGLERALQDAGLKTADNGLQFSLRDQSLNDQSPGPATDTGLLVADDEALAPIDVIPQRYGRLPGQGGGLDIRV